MEQGRFKFPVFKAAAVQAAPVWKDAPDYFDAEATLAKAVKLIAEAGCNGARLIVFPESWMPSYCYWSLDIAERPRFSDIWAKYLWSSVTVPGPETEALCAAAKRAGAYVVMGINESNAQYRGRMHNSMLYISPRGEILGVHRKICVTVQERLFHTAGDGGDNLKTVFKTDIGILGGSICGEHAQPTLLYNWIMQGIEVHCSLWPGNCGMENGTDIKSRAFCDMAKAYGVIAATYIPEESKPKNFYSNSYFNIPGSSRGGSGIVSPRGEYIAGPVYDTETIVYGDIDLSEVDRPRAAVNLTGLYARWDILRLCVQEETYQPLVPMASQNGSNSIVEVQEEISRLKQQIAALENALHGLSASAPAVATASAKRTPG